MDAVDLAERHQKHASLVEADDLGEHRRIVRQASHTAQLAHRDVDADGFDHQSDHACGAAILSEARLRLEPLEKTLNHR